MARVFSSKNGILKLLSRGVDEILKLKLPKTEKYFRKPIDKSNFGVYNKSVNAKNGIIDDFLDFILGGVRHGSN